MSSSLIPAGIMAMVSRGVAMDNREVIVNYLVSQEGSVVLNEKQQELLRRWNAADDLMRSLRYSSREVAEILKKKFAYSVASAWRDIEDARYVFGTTRKVNKDYLLALHIERIEAQIIKAEKIGADYLPKLYDAYNNALKQLPRDKQEEQAPTAIIFQISGKQFSEVSPVDISGAEAAAIAADRLAKMGVEIEDILFEEIEGDD